MPGTCRFLEQHYGVEVLDGPGPVDDAGGWQAWLFNVIAQRGERCPFDETTSEAGTPADASKAWQLEELLNVMEDVGIPLDE